MRRELSNVFAFGGVVVLFASVFTSFAGEKPDSVSGTYKDALRKAGQAGKPLMLVFHRDDQIDCKRLDEQLVEIPDMMGKFVFYRLDAERNPALVKEFEIHHYPTILYLKPDGTEFDRQTGILNTALGQKEYMMRVLDKAPPIPVSQRKKEIPAAQKPAMEAAASAELKSAMQNLTVRRTNDAVRALKQITTKYPDTTAAEQAQEKLKELSAE